MKDKSDNNGFPTRATWLTTLHIGYDSDWLRDVYSTAAHVADYAALEDWLKTAFEERAFYWQEFFEDGKGDEKSSTELLIEELVRYAVDDIDFTYLARHYFDAISDEERTAHRANNTISHDEHIRASVGEADYGD